MSRTKRRKRGPIPYWVTTDWKRIDGHFRRYELEGEEAELQIVKYHSDWGCGRAWLENAPAWFRHEKERIKRARDKAELRRMITQGDYEEYLFSPRRKDVGWDWW